MADTALDVLSWIARGVGLFYLLGGLSTLRAARMELFLDDANARITLEKADPGPADRLRVWTMVSIAILTIVSGALLIFLLRPAVYVFLTNAALQGAYLAWARKALPPPDGDSALGRQRATNAFIVWLVMTALVLLLFEQGRLT
jgi:4-hydroxybenzoate polyprenyltransferase